MTKVRVSDNYDPLPDGDIKQLLMVSANFHVEKHDDYMSRVIIDLMPQRIMHLFPMPKDRSRQVSAFAMKFMDILEQHEITPFGSHTHLDPADLDPETRDESVRPGRPPWRIEFQIPSDDFEAATKLAKAYNVQRVAVQNTGNMIQ